MWALIPRAILVTRPTEYEMLLAQHGTRAQVRFALEDSGQGLEPIDERHKKVQDAIVSVTRAIPSTWRRVRLMRAELDRFVFEPSDVVLVVGQDGLVANVAKYLQGQLVIGFNPDLQAYEGVLVRHNPAYARRIIDSLTRNAVAFEDRAMVRAQVDDGQTLIALNELFIGHRSHQSARYRIQLSDIEERQSSSGVIISTGTGSTGWARSINAGRKNALGLPRPTETELALFVREAFAAIGFQATITQALLGVDDTVTLISEMDDAGVIFGDGIEQDAITFGWGARATVKLAPYRLRLAVPELEKTLVA